MLLNYSNYARNYPDVCLLQRFKNIMLPNLANLPYILHFSLEAYVVNYLDFVMHYTACWNMT